MTRASTNRASVVITSLYARSDVGNVRSNNEDNFVIADLVSGRAYTAPQSIKRKLADNRLLMAVSDGMGGARSGEIAAALAVYGLRLELLSQPAGLSIVERLVKAVEKINRLIWRESQRSPKHKGMGAAISVAVIEGGRAYVAQVGDSRPYIVRRGKIKQLTTDQSLFESLLKSSTYKPEQKNLPARNVTLQSLGGKAEVQVAVSTVELRVGDHILLCSDGLTNKLSADEICKFIVKSPNLESACTAMVDLVKKRGGEDNITVVLTKFEGDGLRQGYRDSSITKAIDIIAAYDPLTGKVDHRTRQMVSDKRKKESEPKLFRSTIGIVPPPEYPKRTEALAESDRSIEMLRGAGKQLQSVVDEVQQLEIWLQKHGQPGPLLQKAIAHLEHAIKNMKKIESVARKTRNLLDKMSTKSK